MKQKQKQKAVEKYKIKDDKNNFQPYNFSKYLNEKYGFVTFEDNDKIYYYDNGHYNPNGKPKIRQEYLQIAENDFNKRTMNQIIAALKGLTTIKRKNFGEPPHLINLENGVYDIKEDKFMEHGPDMQFLSKIPWKYKKGADCPKIKEFVKDVVHDSDVDLMQEIFGYCLYRDYNLNKAFMLLGEGRNGKTTFINLLEKFLGEENSANESLQDILQDRYAKARIYRKYVNVDADISDNVLKDTENFKKLTGEDTISARRPYGKGFNFTNHAKFIFAANNLPRTRDDSLGFFRRWILIDFPYNFTKEEDDEHKDRDDNILEKLVTEEEMSGLINWAIEGLKRLLENGFSTQGNASNTKERWIEKSDTLAAFIDQHIKVESGAKMQTQEFFEHYSKFCQERDATPHDQRTIGKRLQKLIPKARKRRIRNSEGDRVAHYFNIKSSYGDEDDGYDDSLYVDGDTEYMKSLKTDISRYIRENRGEDGVSYQEILDGLSQDDGEIEKAIDGLLDSGDLFEVKPGRVDLT